MRRINMVVIAILIAIGSNAQSATAIKDVNVIDVKNGVVMRNMTVIIHNNRIEEIGPARKTSIPAWAVIIDGRKKYLIPGLWDMHTHTLRDTRPEEFFPLFVANGVTSIRDMGAAFSLEKSVQLRKDILAGKVTGPRLAAITGKILDGPGPNTDTAVFVMINNAEVAREQVRSYKQQGADFIKVYNLLPRDVYLAIADEAKKQKIPFEGHIPFCTTAAEASDLRQKTNEHTSDLFVSSSPYEAALRKEIQEQSGAQSNFARARAEAKAAENYDEQKANALFKKFVANNTAQCPTMIVRRMISFSSLDGLMNNDNFRYISGIYPQRWKNVFTQQVPLIGDTNQRRKRFSKTLEVTYAMQKAGVTILAGTDTPNPFVVPGFSLHEELALMVQSGFTPIEALRTATLNPAVFLEMTDSLGSIEKGKIADLILLNANPLENIENTKRIDAVILNGRYLYRQDLDKMLSDTEARLKK